MKYLLIDTANMFFRARHVAFRATDPWEKVGYALHITLSAVNKVYNQFSTVTPDSYHYGPDAHQYWANFLYKIVTNK
jgi:hypothetical protein